MKQILLGLLFTVLAPSCALFGQVASLDFYTGATADKQKEKGINWVVAIAVTDPAYGAEIKGDTTITFKAPNMTKVKAMCWQQPNSDDQNPLGHDATVAADVTLDAEGNGTFVFPADKFPNGPITLRIYAKDDGVKQDLCELQLFNKGGEKWNQGIPQTDPPEAQGMKLAFSDDFTGPLSISHDGIGTTYQSHKTGGGDFSGWQFTSSEDPMNPFSQVGTWMKIHASQTSSGKSSGLISSAHEDGTGFFASAPCYFECRFMAQSAPGTWPAFWLLTQGGLSKDKAVRDLGSDEYDVIEAYGGKGPGNPNFPNYAATSHYWGQKNAAGQPLDKAEGKDDHHDISMMDLGSKSSWSTTFHTYGIKITTSDVIYYFDDMEVFRHTNKGLAKTQPLWFLVNYAIGGISGWKIHMDRYNNQTDMWVDYIRVYQGQ